jgi:hypothetical protein
MFSAKTKKRLAISMYVMASVIFATGVALSFWARQALEVFPFVISAFGVFLSAIIVNGAANAEKGKK